MATFITHGIKPAAFVLNLRSWLYWMGKQREVTCIEIHQEPDGTYQAYAFGRIGNVIHPQHNAVLGEKPEPGRGYRGNGITYDEFLTILRGRDKRLSEKQVQLIGKFLPKFAQDYQP